MLENAAFEVEVLPSAVMDIVRGRFFYDSIELGLGLEFRNDVVGEIDKLESTAGIDEVRKGYYCRLANRFHQIIYYKVQGRKVTVWRVLDQRFNPRRIAAALQES